MSKGRVFKLLFLPILVGLIVTTVASYYLKRLEPVKAPVEMAEVVVAAKAVPAKSTLTRELLVTRQVPKQYIGTAEIVQLDEALGKITTVPLAQGEQVLKTKLALKDSKVGLAYHVPKGTRAMTIKVNEINGVGGFPEPGDNVDILVTLSKELVGIDKTRILAENIPVLAVAQDTEARASGAKREIKSYSSLTLAVTPEEALKITLGEERGSLRVLLRPVQASEKSGDLEITAQSFGGPAPTAPAASATSTAKPKR
ncbi:MAG: Flp pilus assembly protein CpaB [Actinobacteria bacterium]|nr:Flp pilus assembly protein CpaB [Actinomycetota bacterium]